MRRKVHAMKVVGVLLTGGMLLQFGSCSLSGLLNQASIGFARQLGAIPAQAVYDATIAPIIDDALGGDDTTAP